MRFNWRIKKFGKTLFFMYSDTQTCEGIGSLVLDSNNLHYPFFDIEKCGLNEAKSGLVKIQVSYGLPDIAITSDKERSFHGLCFAQVKWTDYLRMQLDLLDMGLLDYNFFYWTVFKNMGTIRTGFKQNRSALKIVDFLYSYPVPYPARIRRVIYDTGLQKRGLTVFLGKHGKIIWGND